MELKAHRPARGDGPQLVFLHAIGALTSGRYAAEPAALLNASCPGVVSCDGHR